MESQQIFSLNKAQFESYARGVIFRIFKKEKTLVQEIAQFFLERDANTISNLISNFLRYANCSKTKGLSEKIIKKAQ